MKRNSLFLVAIASAIAGASLVPSRAAARDRHGAYRAHHGYRHFGNAYSYAPWYAPRYSARRYYGYAPRYEYEVPFYGRIDSNLNPDRQMVGIND
jgi:hypothetical protein